LVSSSGWAPVGKGTISSEYGVARNLKLLSPGAEKISLLEKNEIILIGRKKRTEFGTKR